LFPVRFLGYAAHLGIDAETALKLTSPFGGGVAHQGEVCGAVTGALMVLGMKRGSATVEAEAKDETYKIAEAFVKRFEELHDTILCRELLGYDLSQPDELKSAREKGVFTSACPVFVKDATELVAEFLDV